MAHRPVVLGPVVGRRPEPVGRPSRRGRAVRTRSLAGCDGTSRRGDGGATRSDGDRSARSRALTARAFRDFGHGGQIGECRAVLLELLLLPALPLVALLDPDLGCPLDPRDGSPISGERPGPPRFSPRPTGAKRTGLAGSVWMTSSSSSIGRRVTSVAAGVAQTRSRTGNWGRPTSSLGRVRACAWCAAAPQIDRGASQASVRRATRWR